MPPERDGHRQLLKAIKSGLDGATGWGALQLCCLHPMVHTGLRGTPDTGVPPSPTHPLVTDTRLDSERLRLSYEDNPQHCLSLQQTGFCSAHSTLCQMRSESLTQAEKHTHAAAAPPAPPGLPGSTPRHTCCILLGRPSLCGVPQALPGRRPRENQLNVRSARTRRC